MKSGSGLPVVPAHPGLLGGPRSAGLHPAEAGSVRARRSTAGPEPRATSRGPARRSRRASPFPSRRHVRRSSALDVVERRGDGHAALARGVDVHGEPSRRPHLDGRGRSVRGRGVRGLGESPRSVIAQGQKRALPPYIGLRAWRRRRQSGGSRPWENQVRPKNVLRVVGRMGRKRWSRIATSRDRPRGSLASECRPTIPSWMGALPLPGGEPMRPTTTAAIFDAARPQTRRSRRATRTPPLAGHHRSSRGSCCAW